jgi:hypothetical protein
VRIGSGNLARFKPLVLSVVNVPKNVSALLSTGTIQGYRTAASVSKAAANQHNLPAGESSPVLEWITCLNSKTISKNLLHKEHPL